MTTTKQPIIFTYDKCPNCGSLARVTDAPAALARAKGRLSPGFTPCIQVLKTVIVDNTLVGKIPLGSTVPAIASYMDICLNCGTYYAIRVEIGEARLGAMMPKVMPR